MPRFLRDLGELPPGCRLALYGAGKFGLHTQATLASARPDVRVACFLDSHRTGELAGLPVVRFDRCVGTVAPDVDLVLVASYFWEQIAPALEAAGLPHRVIHPAANYGHFFDPAELAAVWPEALAAAEGLEHPDDRACYLECLRRRAVSPERLRELPVESGQNFEELCPAFAPYPPQGCQYEDFVDFRRVRVVIEGGVFDGRNTLSLLRRLPADGRLHAFEPQAEAATAGPLRAALAADPRLELLPLGLWSAPGRLRFQRGGEGSCLVPGSGAASEDDTVDVTSIDAFCAERGLSRLDLIKLDVEGAELEVLKGAARSIARLRPALAVSIYHTKRDMLDIPLHLMRSLDGYSFRIGHYSTIAFETVLYAIPRG